LTRTPLFIEVDRVGDLFREATPPVQPQAQTAPKSSASKVLVELNYVPAPEEVRVA